MARPFMLGPCSIIGLMLCTGILCQNGCNYWYEQVPKSSNQTNCSTRTGDSITLACAVYHPCDNISIEWYRSDTEGGDIRSERISSTDDGKYLETLTGMNAMTTNDNFINCCFSSSLLAIHQFTHNEAGYYWCQIVTPNRRLQNSPDAFISLHRETVDDPQTCTVAHYINHLSPPICVTDRTYVISPTERRTCTSSNRPTRRPSTTSSQAERATFSPESTTQSSLTSTSSGATITKATANSESTDNNSTGATSTEAPREESTSMTNSSDSNMLWVYLLITGVIVIVAVAFVVCFIIFYGRYRSLQKQVNVNHSEGATSDNRANIHLRLHPNISYNKVTLREKDDRLSSTIPTDQSSQTDSERETPLDTTPVSEGNHYRNVYTDSSMNMGNSSQANNELPEYATVSKLKKTTKAQNTPQAAVVGSVDYAEVGNGERHKPRWNATSATNETLCGMSMLEAPQYPPPVYEKSPQSKRKPQPTLAMGTQSQGQDIFEQSYTDKRSPTPEYAAVGESTRFSTDFTEQATNENSVNYHSLENPNEYNATHDESGGDHQLFDSDIYTEPGVIDSRGKEAWKHGLTVMNSSTYPPEPDYADPYPCGQEPHGVDEVNYYHTLENPILNNIVTTESNM